MKFEGTTQECEIGVDDCFKKLVRIANKNRDIYELETMVSIRKEDENLGKHIQIFGSFSSNQKFLKQVFIG